MPTLSMWAVSITCSPEAGTGFIRQSSEPSGARSHAPSGASIRRAASTAPSSPPDTPSAPARVNICSVVVMGTSCAFQNHFPLKAHLRAP